MGKTKWDTRALTSEAIQEKIMELEEQILAFELMVRYEEKLQAFMDIYMEWYEGRLNLMELLTAMMDRSICKRISVFSRD